MTVGIVIVHFGDTDTTRRCLASVLGDTSSVQRQTVVVDNQGNLEAGSLPAGVLRLVDASNPGYGEGANRGIARLRANGVDADGWVILNNDVEIEPGFLDAAANGIASDRVGAVGGPIRIDSKRGKLWYAGGHIRWWSGTVCQYRDPRAATRARRVRFIPGTAIAVNDRAFTSIDGFDPGFFLYHEDVDLCLRLQRAGWALQFEPDMAVVHHMGASTGSRERSPLYLEAMARTRLRAFQPRSYRLYLGLVHSVWIALQAASFAVRSNPEARLRIRALLRGHGAALAEVFKQ